MKELIERGTSTLPSHLSIASSAARTERYIRDDREFARELMKRATEDHIVKAKEGVNLEGARLTTFLLNVQEYEAAQPNSPPPARTRSRRTSRRKRPRKENRFRGQEALEKLLKEIDKSKLKLEGKIAFDGRA